MSKQKLSQGEQLAKFNERKTTFFKEHQLRKVVGQTRIEEEITLINQNGRKYRQMMENEVALLNQIGLIKKSAQGAVDNAEHLAYLLELCAVLTVYYDKNHYNSPQAREKYRKICEEIEALQAEMKLDHTNRAINELFEEQKTSKFKSLTNQKAVAGIVHVERISWTFFRLTLTAFVAQTLAAAEAAMIKDAVNLHVGDYNISIEICNALSVGLLAFRFFGNLAELSKHTKDWDSFKNELEKRIYYLLNDSAWMVINLITNYNRWFTMPGFDMTKDVFLFGQNLPIASIVTSAFLLFDVLVLTFQWFAVERPQFEMNKARLDEEKKYLDEELQEAQWEGTSEVEIRKRLAINKKEKDALEINRIQASAAMGFNILAASLLVVGFTASMFFSGGMALPIMYAVVLLGCGFYHCANGFGKLVAAQAKVQQVHENKGTKAEEKEAKEARTKALKEFGKTLVKHIVIPGLVIAVCAVCWQAALAIVLAYAAFMLIGKGLSKWKEHQEEKAKKQAARTGDAGSAPHSVPATVHGEKTVWFCCWKPKNQNPKGDATTNDSSLSEAPVAK